MKQFAAAIASLLATAALSAQHPPAPSVRLFRDSLLMVTDRAALPTLLARERTGPVQPKSLQRLRHAWALIRLGELADSAPPLTTAAQEAYEAAGRAPRPAEAWFAVGAAKEVLDAIGAREFRSQHQTAGTGWRQGAIIAFLEALRLDPEDHEAAIEAAKLTLRDDYLSVRAGVGEGLEAAVRVDSLDPSAWLLLGRFYRRQLRDSAATIAYARAVTLGGTAQGVASLELARELIWLGAADSGERVYYRGAAAPDTATARAYRRELAILAPDSVLALWDSVPPSQRPAWLHEFWRSREVASGRPEGSRLREHERRWRLAYRQYRLTPAWAHSYEWGMPYRSGNDDIDDRGIIFIRHGDPDQRIIHPAALQGNPAETWVYERPEGRLIFHFTLSPTVSGWRMVESVRAIMNDNAIADLIGVDPIYLSIYQASMNADTTRRSAFEQRERLMVLASIHRGTITDSDPLRFERRFHPIVQAYGVGGDLPGTGRLLLIWALPGTDRPPPDSVPGLAGVVYPIRTRFVVKDTTGHLILAMDTIERFHYAAPLPPDRLLVGMSVIDLAAGTFDVVVVIADSGEAQGALRLVSDVPVPGFRGTLEMGDLVLGLKEQGLFWEAPTERFPLNPRHAWARNETMEVAFELGGLTPGTSYTVQLGISELGADSTKPPKASVEFENQAVAARQLVTQSLGLGSLKPGRYLLTAVVTTAQGVLRRGQRFTIAEAR